MKISREKLQKLAQRRGLTLKALLAKAKVSKTAYYSLLKNESVLPDSIHSIAETLGVSPSNFLEEKSETTKKLHRLQKRLNEILKEHPEADRDNVWHSLVLLEEKPIDRLKRGLLRAFRGHPARRRRRHPGHRSLV